MCLFKRIIRSPELALGGSVFDSVPSEQLDAARGRIKYDPREELRKEAELLRSEAKAAGFAEGHLEGMEAGRIQGLELGRVAAFQQFEMELQAELTGLRSELEQAMQRLSSATEQFYQQAENELATVGSDVVERILQAELQLSHEAVVSIVRAAISDVSQSRSVKVRLNPFDSALVQKHRDEILHAFNGLQQIEVVDDPTIAGGCIVESDHGVVDATIQTTLTLLDGEAA